MYIGSYVRRIYSPVNRAGYTLRLQWFDYPCRDYFINHVDVHLPSIIGE